jgi:hypothetical protein
VDVTPVANSGTGYADGCAGDVDAPTTVPEHDVSFVSPSTTSANNFWSNKVVRVTNAEQGHVRSSAEAVTEESSAVSMEPHVDRKASPFEVGGPEVSLPEIVHKHACTPQSSPSTMDTNLKIDLWIVRYCMMYTGVAPLKSSVQWFIQEVKFEITVGVPVTILYTNF